MCEQKLGFNGNDVTWLLVYLKNEYIVTPHCQKYWIHWEPLPVVIKMKALFACCLHVSL